MTQRLFTYLELPEESKQIARQWWKTKELSNPSWHKEHLQSLNSAIEAIQSNEIENLKAMSLNMELTGFISDQYLWDFIEGNNVTEFTHNILDELREYYNNKWEEEMEYRRNDDDFIGEQLITMGYTFSSTGDHLN